MEKKIKTSFNRRSFVSVGMFTSALFLPISGVINHQLQFDELTMHRHFWMSVHNSAAILFCIFIIFHLKYNWKSMINHMRRITEFRINKEAMLATLLVISLIGLFSAHAFHIH